MADLFASLLPDLPEGEPEGGDLLKVAAKGGRALYKHAIQPMMSPAGIAMGALGAASPIAAGIMGAGFGIQGIRQGVRTAQEGGDPLDVAVPAILGAAGLFGLAAAGAMLKGGRGRIPPEALSLSEKMKEYTASFSRRLPQDMPPMEPVASTAGAKQLELPFEERNFIHSERKPPQWNVPKGRRATPARAMDAGQSWLPFEPQRPEEFPMREVEYPAGDEKRPHIRPFTMLQPQESKSTPEAWNANYGFVQYPPRWHSRAFQLIDSLADDEGLVEKGKLLNALADKRARAKSGKEGAMEAKHLTSELDTFQVEAALKDYMDGTDGRKFSPQELKAATLLQGLMDNTFYEDIVDPQAPLLTTPPAPMETIGQQRWARGTLATAVRPPTHLPGSQFEMFVTLNPRVADALGWSWGDGHSCFERTLSGVPIVNPIVRFSLAPYTFPYEQGGRKELSGLGIIEAQAPFRFGDHGTAADSYPKFYLENMRWLRIGIRSVIRLALERGYDTILIPSPKLMDSLGTAEFPHLWSTEGTRKGINWRKTVDGKIFLRANAPYEAGSLAVTHEYTKEELYNSFDRDLVDRLLAEAELKDSGMLVDDFPIRPIPYTRKVYGDGLISGINDELRRWGGEAKPFETQVYLPDDGKLFATGHWNAQELQKMKESSSYLMRAFAQEQELLGQPKDPTAQVPEDSPYYPQITHKRWFEEVQLGWQPFIAFRIKQPAAYKVVGKGSYVGMVPPAVGLGLGASHRSEEER